MFTIARKPFASMVALGLAAFAAQVAPAHAWTSTAVANDGFDRSVSSGWGTAPSGGTWTTPTGATSASVANSQALVNLPAGKDSRVQLSATALGDVDARTGVRVPSGRETFAGVDLRVQSGSLAAYRTRVHVQSNGTTQLQVLRVVPGQAAVTLCSTTLGFTASADQTVNVEGAVTGTSPVVVQARAWIAGSTTPAWQMSCSDSSDARLTDAGTVGVEVYALTAGSYAFDDFWAGRIGSVQSVPSSSTAGAAAPGGASYPVPSDALVVAPWGNDQAAGTASAPLRTLAGAISRAGSGATVVLRAGTYHETVQVPSNKSITIENQPGEAVWLDGASAVDGFTASGGKWVRSNWTTQFDSSHTFTRGAPDGTSTYWQFVGSAHPMAANPDQVWVNGQALTQVASADQVVAGTFAVDYSTKQLWIGTDPSGASVTASTLNKAITVLSPNTTIRGIGVRDYADSVPDMGVITDYGTGLTVENVVVQNSATVGVGVYRTGSTLRHVTVDTSGMLGIHGNLADGLTMDAVKVTNSNSEHFNTTPAAAAVKLSTTRTVTLRDSVLQGTLGNAFWTDESCYDIAVVHNRILDNAGRGIFLELSQKAVIVGNVVANSTDDQIRIANTDQAQVWNNTIIGSTVPVHIAQDSRTPSNSSYAVDPRRPSPDPDMTWVIKSTTVGNNVLQASGGNASALLLVEDWTKQRTGSSMVSSADGDLFSQPVAGRPGWLVAWARGTANDTYTTLSGFQSGQGKEAHGRTLVGSSAVDSSYALASGVQASSSVTLPSDVATRAGVTQVATLGAW